MKLIAEGEPTGSHLEHNNSNLQFNSPPPNEPANSNTPFEVSRQNSKLNNQSTKTHSQANVATHSLALLIFVIIATFTIALLMAVVVAPYDLQYLKYLINFPLDGAITALLAAYLFHQLIFGRLLKLNSRKSRISLFIYHTFVIALSAGFEGGVGHAMSSYIQKNGYRVIAMKMITITFTFSLYAFYLAIQQKTLVKKKKVFKANKVAAIPSDETQIKDVSLNPAALNEGNTSHSNTINRLDQSSISESPSPERDQPEEPHHHQMSRVIMLFGLAIFTLISVSQFCGSLIIGGFFDSLLGQHTLVNVSVCLLYPITMEGFKIALSIVNTVLKLDMEEYIDLISLPFAALPYRTLYFSVDEPNLAGAIIGVKIIYKAAVYVLFANTLHFLIPFTTNVKLKLLSCITRKKHTVDKELQRKKVENRIEELAKGFQVLQFSDIYMNLAVVAIAYIIKWIRPDHQLLAAGDEQQYSLFLTFAFIEVSVDTAIWIIVILIWKFCSKNFRGFHFLKTFKEFLHEVSALYILVNWALFTLIFLILGL